MIYNPEIHHRRSVRLKGFDYSQCGYYFVTVCTQAKRCFFGKIEKDRMVLNDAGKMIERWWNELKNNYANIEIDIYVIMPNHCHGIINIVDTTVGADLCVRPDNNMGKNPKTVGADLCVRPDNNMGKNPKTVGADQRVRPNEQCERGRSINTMVQWFKTMTTNEYIRNVKQNHWEPFDGKLWQRDYYEHIIRNETSLRNVRVYIVNNPMQWQQDDLFV